VFDRLGQTIDAEANLSSIEPQPAGHNGHDRKRAEWTSMKLDMLTCLNFDRRVPPRAFKVAFCILQHVNAETRTARLTDETIAEVTAGSERHVVTARKLLRDLGWFTWERTRDANVYRPNFDQVNRLLDALAVRRDLRHERQRKRRERRLRDPTNLSDHKHPQHPQSAGHDPTNLSDHKSPDPTNPSEHDPTNLSVLDPTNLSVIHLIKRTP
jgi:hypothetical protein